ncbi:hypothetical protein ANO14919_143090 [Xylariales sp. No.14919]|nr:hypothetical protein ANO14919_143090 [Xylariales sp. No.14919]
MGPSPPSTEPANTSEPRTQAQQPYKFPHGNTMPQDSAMNSQPINRPPVFPAAEQVPDVVQLDPFGPEGPPGQHSREQEFTPSHLYDNHTNTVQNGDTGLTAPRVDRTTADWQGTPGVGSWNSGMPDIFGGATWESLLDIINQDNVDWNSRLY